MVSCTTSISTEPLSVAQSKLGLNEHQHRTVLKRYVGVDPRYTEWCAAFVNAVLQESNIDSLTDTGHRNPLAARSWLEWGESVDTPRAGDIVIFPRGKNAWQGHVGFYAGSVVRDSNGRTYYRILGGNQNDRVSIVEYPANKALGIRRASRNK